MKGGVIMGTVYGFEEEKLIIGVIYHKPEILEAALHRLVEWFGPIEDVSEEFSFSAEFSEYYDEEIGGEGFRRIYSFRDTVDPSRQAEIKEMTNALEAELSEEGRRLINLDPGFINHGRLMLATTKATGFRVPLERGIYTELTLYWARGGWQKFPWTYRDYQSERVQRFITGVRAKYLSARREKLRKIEENKDL